MPRHLTPRQAKEMYPEPLARDAEPGREPPGRHNQTLRGMSYQQQQNALAPPPAGGALYDTTSAIRRPNQQATQTVANKHGDEQELETGGDQLHTKTAVGDIEGIVPPAMELTLAEGSRAAILALVEAVHEQALTLQKRSNVYAARYSADGQLTELVNFFRADTPMFVRSRAADDAVAAFSVLLAVVDKEPKALMKMKSPYVDVRRVFEKGWHALQQAQAELSAFEADKESQPTLKGNAVLFASMAALATIITAATVGQIAGPVLVMKLATTFIKGFLTAGLKSLATDAIVGDELDVETALGRAYISGNVAMLFSPVAALVPVGDWAAELGLTDREVTKVVLAYLARVVKKTATGLMVDGTRMAVGDTVTAKDLVQNVYARLELPALKQAVADVAKKKRQRRNANKTLTDNGTLLVGSGLAEDALDLNAPPTHADPIVLDADTHKDNNV